jgi:hypothetical protein
MPRMIWAGAERSNELTRCIEKNPFAPEEKILSRPWRQRQNGPPQRTCRGGGENSNIAIAPGPPGSGFIAAMRGVMDKIFSQRMSR